MYWKKCKIVHSTMGHTDGSRCFTIANYLFTGDTLINDSEAVTRLPEEVDYN